ncbi:MAG: tetratricopeptide repeat protein, partial [Deltaproteobacteria bacterium]|nr:tetratricopeptide repeat protein [Deltaproteobacteria bacterium]
LIMYGESLFQTGHYDQAENVYLQIDGNSPFFNQSLYRLSEIERRKGDEENSLRFLGKIVDTGNKDLWQRYALEELQYAETTAYIKSISPAIQMTPVIETAENRD